ncbi:cation:proton antiporter [Ramlibacter sp. AW1]|uniref:Cation:proton antiporter n=1 Tax=Ramlibacter aurantiacus TaxID=2801330 RepID=A0A936ZIZ6_9BURK|nr:cation:proton antiporter [Ramlibacter aurantiacus]MBL0421782.1 cation:proton antiporter [Ramlibacter aurantiacus]
MLLSLPLENHILQFTLLVTAALLVQITVERVKLPGLIGLLLIGIAIGPGALHVLPREPVAELMGEIGLVYIMFLAGIEIKLSVLREHRREVAGFGACSFALTFAATLAAAWLLDFSWQGALLLATALSSHTLVAYPVVKQLGLLQRQPVVTAVGGTLLTDTLALVALAILVQTASGGEGGAWAWLRPLVLLAVLVAVSALTVPWLARRLFASERIARAEKALFVLVVLLVLASAARVIGTESILGAFLAGLCLNPSIRGRHELHEHLGFVGRMVFIPFFFIDTGMRIELAVLLQPQVWTMAGAMLAAVLLAKSAAAWAAGAWWGYGRNDRLLMIGLTTPQAAATLAVTVTANSVGALDAVVVDAVVVVILLTCLFGPLLARYAGHRVVQTREPAPQSPVKEPQEEMG